MKKEVKLTLKSHSGCFEVVGRVHGRQARERFELPSDKVRRRFEDKNLAIDRAAKIETYVAGLGLRRNLQVTVLKPEQIRDAETAINPPPQGPPPSDCCALAG